MVKTAEEIEEILRRLSVGKILAIKMDKSYMFHGTNTLPDYMELLGRVSLKHTIAFMFMENKRKDNVYLLRKIDVDNIAVFRGIYDAKLD